MAKQPNGWTEAEDQVMIRYYRKGCGSEVTTLLPNRTWRAIKGRACVLGITKREIAWTAEQTELMHKHYAELGAAAVAKMLGRTPASVWHRAQAMKLVIRKKPASRNGRAKTGPKPKKNLTFSRPVEKPHAKPFKDMDGVITADTKVRIAPPFVDLRWLVEVATKVVDSAQCRMWLIATETVNRTQDRSTR